MELLASNPVYGLNPNRTDPDTDVRPVSMEPYAVKYQEEDAADDKDHRPNSMEPYAVRYLDKDDDDHKEEDSAEYHSSGVRTSGVYQIDPLPADVDAYCDMDTAGDNWTVIQRRQDGSVPFNRNWEDYKLGFGNKNGEYWLGNENIHLLTNQKNYSLRIDLCDWQGESRYAEYSTFRVSGESDGYRLHISGYSGNAGDAMAHHDGMMFSTVDRDNDASSSQHCSQNYGQAGWWFGCYSHANLNGRYLGDCGDFCTAWKGVVWNRWRGHIYSLKSVSMKIR
ncbi:microfibril-associated glycoprotein 4-like [Branchiostoma floridae]|uniref:Microfibril-associated glycoprotein 4-like n=1 Tax=Branchiostoma floridae TaxID=7739 RepID=A0A9J7HQ98_BRAFL|nr:microfibril-associated glycoprotein 4-like [Branchiostoma floridae]